MLPSATADTKQPKQQQQEASRQVEKSLFFTSATRHSEGIELVDEAVCELCSCAGVAVAPEDTHRLVPNLTALLGKLLVPTARFFAAHLGVDAAPAAARAVLSTLTPSPAAPLFADVVPEAAQRCTVRIAAADKAVVCDARAVLWANLHAGVAAPTDEPVALDMHRCSLALGPRAAERPAATAADVAEAFVAAAQHDVALATAPYHTRPLFRCALTNEPAVELVGTSEEALRTVLAQLKTRLATYIAPGTTTATTTVAAAAAAMEGQQGEQQGDSVRSRARSVPAKTVRPMFLS